MVYVFDPWLDDSLPWTVEEYVCACGRRLVLIHRVDKYAVCPHCVITDRASRA